MPEGPVDPDIRKSLEFGATEKLIDEFANSIKRDLPEAAMQDTLNSHLYVARCTPH
jgi:hypothetical protein